jgi:hypothetical protein
MAAPAAHDGEQHLDGGDGGPRRGAASWWRRQRPTTGSSISMAETAAPDGEQHLGGGAGGPRRGLAAAASNSLQLAAPGTHDGGSAAAVDGGETMGGGWDFWDDARRGLGGSDMYMSTFAA